MKVKLLMKMIRKGISTILMFFVSLSLFLFKLINNTFSNLIKRLRRFFRKFIIFYNDNNTSIKEGVIALFICVFGDLIAGIILGKMTFFLEEYPGLLVLIPGAIGMRGNIFGSFGSRLSSNLHIGILTPEFKKSETLNQNILSSVILTLILSLFLAIVAKLICIGLNFESMSFVDFTLISVFAGLISTALMLPITMFISLKSFQNGWDPDNVATPIIGAFGDLFTLPAIILAILFINILDYGYLKEIVFFFLILIIILSFIQGLKSSQISKKIISESTPVLLLCSFLGVFSGSIFNSSLSTLIKNPSLLTLLPLFSGESGSLISILGARFSSAIHSGLIEPIFKPKKNILYNFLITFILAIIFFPFIGFLADLSSIIFHINGLGFNKIIPISTLSGFILIPIMAIIVFYITVISYRRGYDPDNIVIPISTSITDSISSLILIVVALVFIGTISV